MHTKKKLSDYFFFFLIVCFTSYFVFSIAVLPHSPGVVYYHLLFLYYVSLLVLNYLKPQLVFSLLNISTLSVSTKKNSIDILPSFPNFSSLLAGISMQGFSLKRGKGLNLIATLQGSSWRGGGHRPYGQDQVRTGDT